MKVSEIVELMERYLPITPEPKPEPPECLHTWVQPVVVIGQREERGRIIQYEAGNAYSCMDCRGHWAYKDPWDLPQWLYERLKEEGRLPLPHPTPAVMEALENAARAAAAKQLQLLWPVET